MLNTIAETIGYWLEDANSALENPSNDAVSVATFETMRDTLTVALEAAHDAIKAHATDTEEFVATLHNMAPEFQDLPVVRSDAHLLTIKCIIDELNR